MNATSFFPLTVIKNDASASVAIHGSGLIVGQTVDSVRFEPSPNCTLTTTGATTNTIAAVGGLFSSEDGTVLNTTIGNLGLSPAVYSVCLGMLSNNGRGNFARIGSVSFLVGAYSGLCRSLVSLSLLTGL